jgi:hypothetical protein
MMAWTHILPPRRLPIVILSILRVWDMTRQLLIHVLVAVPAGFSSTKIER